jgi:uncharacterized protein (TIGR03435 family)
MAQLAKQMGRMIAESLGTGDDARPRVQDKTGLAGTFDFRLEYSCLISCMPAVSPVGLPRVAQARQQAEASGQPAPAAADPTGSQLPNIFRAVEEQLGLKLQKVKAVPVDVIVVDRIAKIPTEN